MDYDCPACNEEQDLAPLHKEIEDGFIFIIWGGCGHQIDLENLEKSIEEQRKKPSKRGGLRGF